MAKNMIYLCVIEKIDYSAIVGLLGRVYIKCPLGQA